MDASTSSSSANSAAAARSEPAARSAQRSNAAAREKKQATAPAPKLTDAGVTVKGRFDTDLRRFFVTIMDTDSQLLITQFPSQAVARYVQQLKKAAAEGEPPPKDADREASQEPKLNQTT